MRLLSALLALLAAFGICCTRGGSLIADPVRSSVSDCQSSDAGRRTDVNKATAKELESLPGIGEVLAARIIEHRNRYGKFRRASDIIIVDGVSEKKYHAIEGLICAGD